MDLDVGIDLQLQIFILAAVFMFILFVIICFLAGICGQLTKVKKIQRKIIQDSNNHPTAYDNYAYSSRHIQPDEELSRRGYTMFDPYRNNNQTSNVHQNSNNNQINNDSLNRLTKMNHIMQCGNFVEMIEVDDVGCRDEAEYAIANAETIVMTGNDVEMKIKTDYPPEFNEVPPPSAFANHFDIEENPNTKKLNEQK